MRERWAPGRTSRRPPHPDCSDCTAWAPPIFSNIGVAGVDPILRQQTSRQCESTRALGADGNSLADQFGSVGRSAGPVDGRSTRARRTGVQPKPIRGTCPLLEIPPCTSAACTPEFGSVSNLMLSMLPCDGRISTVIPFLASNSAYCLAKGVVAAELGAGCQHETLGRRRLDELKREPERADNQRDGRREDDEAVAPVAAAGDIAPADRAFGKAFGNGLGTRCGDPRPWRHRGRRRRCGGGDLGSFRRFVGHAGHPLAYDIAAIGSIVVIAGTVKMVDIQDGRVAVW